MMSTCRNVNAVATFSHNVYCKSYDDLKDFRSYAVHVPRHSEVHAVEVHPSVHGNLSLVDVPQYNIPDEAARNMVGKVRLLIGQLPYSITRDQLAHVLCELTQGATIYGLRPQYRKNTGKRQVTGVWFADIHVSDVAKFTDIHRHVLMAVDHATIFQRGMQHALFAWCKSRDAAVARQEALTKTKAPRALQPMTVEIQKEDRMLVFQLRAGERMAEVQRKSIAMKSADMYNCVVSLNSYTFRANYCTDLVMASC